MRITDVAPYNTYGEPVYHRYLEYVGPNSANVSGKSDKYWEVAAFKRDRSFVVVRRWGKYGAKGRFKEEPFWGKSQARNRARALKAVMRAKGYTKEIDVITRLGMRLDEDAA